MKHRDNLDDLNIAKIESKIDGKFINDIILKEGYIKDFNGLNMGKYIDKSFLRDRFYCHTKLREYFEIKNNRKHIVTGFGPTNAPTAGTLSIILKAILFSKSGIDTTIVISDLGAFNSRNVEMDKLLYLSEHFKNFIKKLGFIGEVRTHDDFKLLRTAAVTSKNLSIEDFINNSEMTTKLYKLLGLQGEDFATLFDLNLCVADILLPILEKKKQAVLVLAGIEEHFLPKIASLIIERFIKNHGSFVNGDEFVASIFSKVLSGFNGYPKMSKSIPDSSISLENTEKEIRDKILNCKKKDEIIILQMIMQASDWNDEKIKKSKRAYKMCEKNWGAIKEEYLVYFLNVKKIWDSTKIKNESIPFFK